VQCFCAKNPDYARGKIKMFDGIAKNRYYNAVTCTPKPQKRYAGNWSAHFSSA
jgi:hypothetical protein